MVKGVTAAALAVCALLAPGENLWTLMHGLMEKTEDDDFAAEISELEAALARQQENRTALDEQMTGDIAQFTERILSVVEG